MSKKISFEDFATVDIRVGTIIQAEPHPDANKLLVLTVAIGEDEPRTIVAGIASFVDSLDVLVEKQICIIANLAPRKIRGIESNGMLLGAGDAEQFSFIIPENKMPNGTRLR